MVLDRTLQEIFKYDLWKQNVQIHFNFKSIIFTFWNLHRQNDIIDKIIFQLSQYIIYIKKIYKPKEIVYTGIKHLTFKLSLFYSILHVWFQFWPDLHKYQSSLKSIVIFKQNFDFNRKSFSYWLSQWLYMIYWFVIHFVYYAYT